MPETATMYDRVGKAPAIKVVVDQLYHLILADDELKPYFAGIDLPQLKRHMAALLAHTLGGPDGYGGRSLPVSHAGLGITRVHYARVADYVLASLLMAHASRDIVDAISQVLNSVEAEVVEETGKSRLPPIRRADGRRRTQGELDTSCGIRRRGTGVLYAALFTAHPETRGMFPASMAAQRDRLVGALGRIVSSVDDLPAVLPFIEGLGRDHRRFDVAPEHFPAVGEALLTTLAHFAGDTWTSQVADDWATAFGLVADVMIKAADGAPDPAYWTAGVELHERRGFDVAVLRLRPEQPLPYVSGQAVSLQIPARPRLWRYYSPANAPRPDGTIDLHIKAVPGGQMSTAVVHGLRPGDQVKLGAPVGNRLLLDPRCSDLLLIGGGTGLAPLKALIEQVATEQRHRRVTLFTGARTTATSTTSGGR